MRKYSFHTAPWIGLAAISMIYTVIILIPFYGQEIYRLAEYQIFTSPGANTPPLVYTCMLWLFIGLPLFLLCAGGLWRTWAQTPRFVRLVKLLILMYVVTAVGLSYLNGYTLYFWALSPF